MLPFLFEGYFLLNMIWFYADILRPSSLLGEAAFADILSVVHIPMFGYADKY